ncbi:MAG: holliday junction helicase RuvA [Frankiales bacterium]|nr:holliday junction helicase RuvA [Frankiales bacterium]
MVSPDGAVVDVGGIGLFVVCTPGTLATLRAGEHARLVTALVVREDALTLYGFATEDERSVFEVLQTVTGVGPRLAQAVLAVHTPDTVRIAVAGEDVGALSLVPGIGRKVAARILLELKGRLGPPDGAANGGVVRLPGDSVTGWRDQLRSALTGLGWSSREVEDTLVAIRPEAEAMSAGESAPDVGVLLKQSLQMLSRA